MTETGTMISSGPFHVKRGLMGKLFIAPDMAFFSYKKVLKLYLFLAET